MQETREHLERRGLACAVRTQKADALAGRDLEGDVFDRAHGRVVAPDRRLECGQKAGWALVDLVVLGESTDGDQGPPSTTGAGGGRASARDGAPPQVVQRFRPCMPYGPSSAPSPRARSSSKRQASRTLLRPPEKCSPCRTTRASRCRRCLRRSLPPRFRLRRVHRAWPSPAETRSI